jgi:hypothetical protein
LWQQFTARVADKNPGHTDSTSGLCRELLLKKLNHFRSESMLKSMVALAIAGAMSAPLAAQSNPQTDSSEAQQAKVETVKKRVCTTQVDRLHNVRKVCRTIEVPAENPGGAEQSPSAGARDK